MAAENLAVVGDEPTSDAGIPKTEIDIDGEKLTLAELAGINIDDVEEKRGIDGLPALAGIFRVKEVKLNTVEMTEKGTDKQITVAVIQFIATLIQIDAVAQLPDGVDEESLIGRDHYESFFIKKLEDAGRFRALKNDLKVGVAPDLPTLFDSMVGIEFGGRIRVMKDKNDPDKTYSHLDMNKGRIRRI